MNKLFAVVFCTVLTHQAANAVVSRLSRQEKPAEFANQEGCYIPDLEMVLSPNQTYNPEDEACIRYKCFDNGETEIAECDTFEDYNRRLPDLPPGCVYAHNDTYEPYPDCCKITTDCSYNDLPEGGFA